MFFPLAAVAVYRYQLPLSKPLKLARGTLHIREGLLLRLQTPEGNVRWGEVSPLPGFSEDCLSSATTFLLEHCRQWAEAGGICCAALPNGLISAGLDGAVSVQCAVDFALSGLSVTPATPDKEAVCPLLTGQGEALQASMLRHQGSDPDVVKLKVGSEQVAEDICRLQQVVDYFGKDIRFRLDANRQWSLNQALAFATGLRETAITPGAIDWLEEPTANPCEFIDFYQETSIRYALDESLRDHGILATGEPLDKSPGLSALIIKPTMTGSLSRISCWIEKAQQSGKAVVISSSFESQLMLNQLSNLSRYLDCLNPPGLDTASAFSASVIISDNLQPAVQDMHNALGIHMPCECILSLSALSCA